MTRPMDLAGFETRFRADPDPWKTFTSCREAIKRRQIIAAAGHRRWSRGLELGAGNGSNSQALRKCVLRLDICEGTARGAELINEAVANCPRARVHQLVLPAPFPASGYDLIVIAELLYYLTASDLRGLGHEISRTLVPGGRLILAHHHQKFADARQHGAKVHEALRGALQIPLAPSFYIRTRHWTVESWDRPRL